MKKSYAIVLFIFSFSLMSTTFEEMGIFGWDTNTDTGITDADIYEINDMMYGSTSVDSLESEEDTFGLFAGAQMVINSISIFIKSIGVSLVVLPTLLNLGIPATIAGLLQGITTLVEAIAAVEFISARRATN